MASSFIYWINGLLQNPYKFNGSADGEAMCISTSWVYLMSSVCFIRTVFPISELLVFRASLNKLVAVLI